MGGAFDEKKEGAIVAYVRHRCTDKRLSQRCCWPLDSADKEDEPQAGVNVSRDRHQNRNAHAEPIESGTLHKSGSDRMLTFELSVWPVATAPGSDEVVEAFSYFLHV